MSKHKFEQLCLYNWFLYLSHFGKYYWFIEGSKEIWNLLTAALINNLSEHTAYSKDITENGIFKIVLRLLAHEFNWYGGCGLRFHLQLFHLHHCSVASPRINGDKSVFTEDSEIK